MIGYTPLPSGQSGGITGTLRVNAWSAGVVDYPLTISVMKEWFDFRTEKVRANGDPVGSLAGRKGLYTLTASGTARPTWAVNDGDGSGAIQFDGVNDTLSAAINSGDLYGSSGVYEVWMAVRGSGSGNATFWSSEGAAHTINIFAQKAFPRIFGYVNSGAEYAWTSAGDAQDNSWHLLRYVKNGTGVKFILDGVELSLEFNNSSGSWAAESQVLNIGSAAGSQFWTGGMRHALYFDGLLDDPTAAALTTYLGGAL